MGDSHEKLHDVVIIGGGPVGLFLALNLVREGLKIVVLEAASEIGKSPRALMYYPVVLREFKKLGILDEVVAAGYKNAEGLCFRTAASASNEVLATIPPGRAPAGEIDFGVQLAQPILTAILLKHCQAEPNFSIKWSTRFRTLEQDADTVTVEAKNATGERVFWKSKFMVGCDGGSSAVRKCLNIPFEGFTWEDWRFLAINIKYPFDKYGYPAANHIIDQENWAAIVRAGNEKEGLWRVATGIDPSIPVEDIEKHVPAKLEKLLPGPRSLKYELEAVSPYWAREMCAKTYRSGRVVLAGDAAHVNNPLTGLGLTTGLVDAAYLARLLPKALVPKPTRPWTQLLDKYASVRRAEFVNSVQKFTIAGKLRLHSQDKKVVAEREDFFNMLNKNPGFGMFIASLQMQKVPEEHFPTLLMRSTQVLAGIIQAMWIIPAIIYWKISALVK